MGVPPGTARGRQPEASLAWARATAFAKRRRRVHGLWDGAPKYLFVEEADAVFKAEGDIDALGGSIAKRRDLERAGSSGV